jgi:hypothetical protein
VVKETAICKLAQPATCEYRVDGKMAFTILCGGNNLFDAVKKCPYRALAEIKELAATDSQQPQAEIAWCKEAFECVMHGCNSDYRTMWQERLNAVLAQLSAVR